MTTEDCNTDPCDPGTCVTSLVECYGMVLDVIMSIAENV